MLDLSTKVLFEYARMMVGGLTIGAVTRAGQRVSACHGRIRSSFRGRPGLCAVFPRKRKLEKLVDVQELSETQGPKNKLIERAINAAGNYLETGVIEECQSLGLALKTLGRETMFSWLMRLWDSLGD